MPSQNISRLTTVTSRWRRQQWNGVVQTINENGPVTNSQATAFTKVRSWTNTPNFFALRRAGAQLPENNFSFESWLYPVHGEFLFTQQNAAGSFRTRREIVRPRVMLCRTPDHGVVLPQVDLYSKLVDRARRSDFSLPVALLEGRQTVQMVAQTARTLASAISNLRRGNLRGAMRALRVEPSRSQVERFNRRFGVNPNTTAANYWLQLQYGWIPLLHDVYNSAEALAIAVNYEELMTTSVKASTRLKGGQSWTNHVLEVSPAYRGNVVASVNLSRRAVWRFRPNAADLPGLFGLTNPLSVVWEIIPFSFVADWFLPIGNYLEALDVPLRFTHVGGTEGFREHTTWTTTPTFGTHIDGFNPIPLTGGVDGTVVKVRVTRTKFTGPPTPTLDQLTMDPKLNARRATSAIALLWQQASRLGR